MASWTAIPNSALEPDAPARSIDVLALRDNPIAIAEGAAGAPKILTAALNNNSVTTEKIGIAAALAATARDATAGAVGTYVFARLMTAGAVFGATAAGSSLRPTSAAQGVSVYSKGFAIDTSSAFLTVGAYLSGTYRCMGTQDTQVSSTTSPDLVVTVSSATLWLRIA